MVLAFWGLGVSGYLWLEVSGLEVLGLLYSSRFGLVS